MGVCVSRETVFFMNRILLLLLLSTSTLLAQTLPPAERYYATLGGLSVMPSAANLAIDTIRFPWAEYGSAALTYTLMEPGYLSGAAILDLGRDLKLPANSSAQTKAELDYLVQVQANASPALHERSLLLAEIGYWPDVLNPLDSAQAQNRRDLFFTGTSVFGSWYVADRFPKSAVLLARMMRDVRAAEFRLKLHFRRARPYHLDTRVQPYRRMRSPAFPSGHTLWAFANSYLLGEIAPHKRVELLALAEEVRLSREVLGIHYPSDNEQARVMAWRLLQAWKRNRAFQKDLAAAQSEYRQAEPSR